MRFETQNSDISLLELTQLVRSALSHLYDHAVLQNHPLVTLLNLDKNLDRVTRAQEVRRILLKCIETLKPEGRNHGQVEAARAYAILTYRYVDGLSMQGIAEKLALSQRQTYREHTKGVKAVAGLILDRVGQKEKPKHSSSPDSQDFNGKRLSIAHAEIERLRQDVKAEALDLQEILAGVLNILTPLSQQLSIQIRLSLPDGLPPVLADRIMLRQALLNLLSRALNTFVRGDLIITASHEKQGILIDMFEVSNTSETQPRSPIQPKEGKVALAVARALIEAQDGRLDIQDQPGHWQTQIVLPTSNRVKILVIDDNADIVALIKRYLGGRNVSVVGITTGGQAVSLAAELQPQLITLDVMMPNHDGWEILQKLKKSSETQHIPVVICSVLNQPQLALSLGASDTIIKPVSQVKLLKVLRRWVGPL
jgi:CheY-like chemotaxis protein